jgi:hypothetical protein
VGYVVLKVVNGVHLREHIAQFGIGNAGIHKTHYLVKGRVVPQALYHFPYFVVAVGPYVSIQGIHLRGMYNGFSQRLRK